MKLTDTDIGRMGRQDLIAHIRTLEVRVVDLEAANEGLQAQIDDERGERREYKDG